MKVTYSIKAIFLFFSWLILFNGLDDSVINAGIFFTSVLIYTGAVIFDLVFLAVETYSKSDEKMNGVYWLSVILIFFNSVICCIEFIGAMGGLKIIENPSETLVIGIVECGLTEVYKFLSEWSFELWIFMILVIVFGILSIVPGVFSLENKDRLNE